MNTREIKFRVWDVDTHEFIDLSCGHHNQKLNNFFKDSHFVFQQYTGLKDKNGVEIYEGDILNNWMWYSLHIVEFGNRLIYMGVESNGEYIYNLTVGFLLRSVKNKEMFDFYFSSKEVLLDTLTLTKTKIVGNIFENTELLKNHE